MRDLLSPAAVRPSEIDQALVALAALVVVPVGFDGARLEPWRLEIADLAPHATRLHPLIGPLAEACDAFVEMGDLRRDGAGAGRGRDDWSRVSWRLRACLETILAQQAAARAEAARQALARQGAA